MTEDMDEAEEGVAGGGGGEPRSDDETLARLRLWTLEETLEPFEAIARGI